MSNLPANRNVKWALSAGLWSHNPPGRFTRILDVMRDTGFIGIRLTGFPGILKKYNLTRSQLESEVSRRSLYVTTISFDGPTNDASQHKRIVKQAREAMQFLKSDGSALIWTGLARARSQVTSIAAATSCAGSSRSIFRRSMKA